jgi:hypothetical protein
LPLREDLHPIQYLDHPDNLMRPLVEEAAAGSVLVLDANQRNDVGMLGGNLVMRMMKRGIAAAVTDGGMRDIPELAEIDFPVFATASSAPPSFTKLMMVDVGAPTCACARATPCPAFIRQTTTRAPPMRPGSPMESPISEHSQDMCSPNRIE